MFIKLKFAIIIVSTVILFLSLTSPYILQDILIPNEHALLITFFIASVFLALKLIGHTHRKKLEEKIFLQHSLMQTIFDSVPFVMYLKDLDGKILYTNKFHAMMIGSTIEKIQGSNISEYYANLDSINEEDNCILQSKMPISVIRTIESKSGVKAWYDIHKVPVFDTSGNISHIVVMFRDITTIKQMEERKDNFVATLTHDLKTPTIAQIKSLDMLLRGYVGQLTEEQKDIVNQTKQSCEYMYNLIFTILDTYKYDNGQLKINYEQFNIRTLVDEVVFELSTLSIDNSQAVRVVSSCDEEIISADRFQIKRVLINLLSNAFNHGKNGTEIEIVISKSAFSVKVEVKSVSKYLSKDIISEIFEKYKSIEHSKSYKTGTGLGLYLSKKIITAHNGEIFATSELDGVCNFGFSIPKSEVLVCK